MQTLVRAVGRALSQTVPTERIYVLSLGSQQGNAHVHWHVVALPPDVPYEQQQFVALMHESHGVIDLTDSERAELSNALRAKIPTNSKPRPDPTTLSVPAQHIRSMHHAHRTVRRTQLGTVPRWTRPPVGDLTPSQSPSMTYMVWVAARASAGHTSVTEPCGSDRSNASCGSSHSSVRNNMRPIISCVTSTGEVAPVATTASSAAAGAHVRVRVALATWKRPGVSRLGTPSELTGMTRLDLLVGEPRERAVVDLGEIADDSRLAATTANPQRQQSLGHAPTDC